MDYKEEYQKALERAKKGLPIDEVFPELKESEDERIREQIVQVLIEHDWSVTYKVRRGDCIAWLEKQKEQKRIVPEREATDFEIEVHEIIAQARSDKRLADKDVLEQFEREAACALMWKAEKQKEQKPAARSEEDENVIADYLYTLNVGFTQAASRERAKDILSLLRPNHWKPSEEQIDALEWMLTTVSMKDGGRGVVLKNLINDLKKQM